MAYGLELVKSFRFSASHQSGPNVFGHNYVLRVAVREADERSEGRLVSAVRELVIDAVHSRDLTLHVDFLRGAPIDDRTLLEAFWKRLEPRLKDLGVLWIGLDRDDRTQLKLILSRLGEAPS